MSATYPAGPAQERGRGPRPSMAARWSVPVFAVMALAALVVCAALGYRAHAAGELESARTEGLEAARSAAPVFMAYDYHHLDRDFARARGLLVGDFKKEYADTTRNVVKPTATKTRAIVRADVRAASVVSATPDRVVALLFVNQTTTSNRASQPRTDLNRVRMTVQRVGERWLVSAVDAL